jgi:hypothetical protein
MDFDKLSRGDLTDDELWKWRYYSFWEEIGARIAESWKSVHIILSNISSLRAVLWKQYSVRKLNNGSQVRDSLEELKGRVRLKQLQVVVIDAVNGFIEISQEV